VLATAPAGCWAEDRWCGETLYRNKIFATINNRYYIAPHSKINQYITDEALAQPNDYITIHSLSPEQMRRHWKERANEHNQVNVD
jgi:low affinity Fe/Cu permease